jgi:hypothetical protein
MRTLVVVALTLASALASAASVIETDCVSDEFLSSSGAPSDDAGEAVSAGERDFSVNLIKSLFKVRSRVQKGGGSRARVIN